MKKILFKKIIIIFTLMGILLFIAFSGLIYFTEKKSIFSDLEEMLIQVELTYEKSLVTTEEKINLYKEDYLNRAYAVDFMISNNPSVRTTEGLQQINKLMELESIHIIDESGEIILSSDISSIGLNLYDHNESQSFWDLIKSHDRNENVIQLDAINISDRQTKDFIGVKSSLDEYSVIQIGINKKILNNLKSGSSFTTILENTPTILEKGIMAVDHAGNIIGSTSNNEQELNIDSITTQEELVDLLKDSDEGRVIKINGSNKFLKTKTLDDLIIVTFTQWNAFYKEFVVQLCYTFTTMVVIFITIILMLKGYFNKYILKDLSSIQDNIKELMSGNYDIHFETENNTELRCITSMLNDWKDSYKYKSTRMSKLIGYLDTNIAVFECLYYIDRNFFSDNTQSILGIDTTLWSSIKSHPSDFENYINDLLTTTNEEGFININDKYLLIKSFKINNEFYGLIMDKTEEIRARSELREIQEVSEKDALTNLMNRYGFEKYVKKSLSLYPNQGLLLIFDLDNFKTINDTLGHPEGDVLLKKFAELLKTNFRKKDIIARLGGDEFVIFMEENLSVQFMEDKLKALFQTLHNELGLYYNNYHISTSIGVAYVNDVINTYEDLYKCADVALYIAKRLGKDRYYINDYNISCMNEECEQCTDDCVKRKLLGL